MKSTAASTTSTIVDVLHQHETELLQEWVTAQSRMVSGGGSISGADLRAQCSEFLTLFRRAAESGNLTGDGSAWAPVKEFLSSISRSRAQQGYSPSETATFVFSLKGPLFMRLRTAHAGDADGLAESTWAATMLIDGLGLHTTELYQRSREEVIARQQQDMLELSTPVVSLWDGILALPMIGTLDSARTQVVMETLLQRIVETGADIAVIDITGVPTVDTLTAQHLLKTVTAARLMGAECIISGIRPQIAQTIVHLGVDLGGVITKASLSDAFRLALQRTGRSVVRTATPGAQASNGSQGSPASGSTPSRG
ncbi:MAG: STAS domain-containing protein [Gemmatimonadota bacterium]